MPRILVIDDDRFVRLAVAKNLEQAGFEVLTASQGDTGLELARKQQPDLILCDVRMQRMDGYEVLAALRDMPETATTPFILMTSLRPEEGMREGMNLGADDYLTKPYTPEDLLASVNAQLRKQEVLREREREHLDRLRASISMALPHELRTPLSGILGSAELLTEIGAELELGEVQQLSEGIYAFGKRLEQLIEDFLVYAQIELLAQDAREVARLRMAHTPEPELVLARVAQQTAACYDRSSDLKVITGAGGVAVAEHFLEKMFAKLLDNAFKFSSPGTPIRALMENDPEGVCFRIIDRGWGMSDEQIQAIGAYMQFERKMHEQQGTGLGLHIVKRLTQLHEGSFHIESQVGEGTMITLLLPKAVRS